MHWRGKRMGKTTRISVVAFVYFGFCIAVLVWALWFNFARARDMDGRYVNSPNREWFQSQHNSVGQWCCDEADGHLYYGDYKLNEDGSVEAEGQRIEPFKVLKGPNPTGGAVWWYVDGVYGRTTYCFAPGGGV